MPAAVSNEPKRSVRLDHTICSRGAAIVDSSKAATGNGDAAGSEGVRLLGNHTGEASEVRLAPLRLTFGSIV